MMAKKQCTKCGEMKSTTEFNKCTKAKSGLQSYCRTCNKSINDINNHKSEVIEKRNIYNKEYMKAGKDGLIYTITNPIGQVYCGSTKRLPNLRWNSHKASYKKTPGRFPLLHSSFDMWGIDAHEFNIINSYENIDTIDLREIESNMIKAYKLNRKSLNVNN